MSKKTSKKAREKQCIRWGKIHERLERDRSKAFKSIGSVFKALPEENAFERGQAATLMNAASRAFDGAMSIAASMNEFFYDEDDA